MNELDPDAKFRDAEIRAALHAVTSSKTFDGANRLQAFLTYVVEESLAGRAKLIRAKRIAEDVYDRPPDIGNEQEALVRVDAGRLRRRLDLYYAEEGRDADIRIVIKPGGYAPSFDIRPQAAPVERATSVAPGAAPVWLGKRWAGYGLAAAAGAVIMFVISLVGSVDEKLAPPETTDRATGAATVAAKRQAVFDHSPAALQARSFAAEARELIFPPLDASRLKAAIEICQRVLQIDPGYYGGHACAAHAKAFIAFLSNSSAQRDEILAAARAHADQAVKIAPEQSLTQSARAFVLFVEGDYDRALETSRRAVRLDPADRFSGDFHGMMTVFNGDAPTLLKRPNDAKAPLHPFILSAAHLFSGNYQDAAALVRRAAEIEGSSSALMTAILVAAHEGAGQTADARRHYDKLMAGWPDYDARRSLRRLFRYEKDADLIADLVVSVDAATD